MNLLLNAIREKRHELGITLFITAILMLIAAFLVFYFENQDQPDNFSDLFSSGWWSLATLTTVGYGDIHPITTMGRIIAGFLSILGIGIVALPTGLISSGFMEKISQKITGPHCGRTLN